MSQWLPLSPCVLLAVVNCLPNPKEAQHLKFQNRLPSNKDEELKKALVSCDSDVSKPIVAYVSKMFMVDRDALPGKKRIQLTAEQMKERKALLLKAQNDKDTVNAQELLAESKPEVKNDQSGYLVAFARIYSGTLKVGDEIKILSPKYDPENPSLHCSATVVKRLFLMMGRDLEDLDQVPAGNIFAIGGLEDFILKSATLSTSLACPNLARESIDSSPIVRVALEAVIPSESNLLLKGLELLNQADPCVQVILQETGEHVIVCAGELHLERCLKDLRENFAKIDIQISSPIVPFRETLSYFPSLHQEKQPLCLTDMASEIQDMSVPFKVKAFPLPPNIREFLITNDLTRMFTKKNNDRFEQFCSTLDQLWSRKKDFVDTELSSIDWKKQLIAFGPK
jgi:ribosome assembly protein 1